MNKLLLYVSCFTAVIADTLLVFYAKGRSHNVWLLVIALSLGVVGIFVWTYTMRKGIEAATAITVYAVFTVLSCSLVGHFVFKEPMTQTNIIGIAVAIIALILMSC